MTRLLPFRPTVTPHGADVARCYDYGPSVAAGRVWWCSGLGTDTIVSAPLPGRPGKLGAPWHIPGKLVADPCAVTIGHQTLVLFTVGDPDGRNNGIGWAVWSDPTKAPTRTGMLIPQAAPGRYGIGQPSLATWGDGSALLAFRDDGANGENVLRVAYIDLDLVALGGPPVVERAAAFTEPEDGASPEAWLLDDGRLAILVSGGGWCGLRTYQPTAGYEWRRERHLETASPVAGGHFHAQAPKPTPGAVDGLGVERDTRNRPVITAGTVHYWQAHGDPAAPGTWALGRFGYRLPVGAF